MPLLVDTCFGCALRLDKALYDGFCLYLAKRHCNLGHNFERLKCNSVAQVGFISKSKAQIELALEHPSKFSRSEASQL
jgi:hypothetical protein